MREPRQIVNRFFKQTLFTGILLILIWLSLFFSHQPNAKINNENWFNQTTPITVLKNTDFFKLDKSHQFINDNDQSQLVGHLIFKPIIGSEYFKLLRNNYDLNVSGEELEKVKLLPEIDFNFTEYQGGLIPDKRTVQRNNHAYWEWLIMPGKISKPFEQTGFNKIVFPFSLQEKNANCTHNGYLSFLIKTNGEVSNGFFQITSETCAYFQFDLAGRIDVDFKLKQSLNKKSIIEEYIKEKSSQTIIYSLSDLTNDFPLLNSNKLKLKQSYGSTTSGIVINNKHYRFNCETRTGTQADCEQLALPSYSTAKSIFAGIAVMRLENENPNIKNTLVTKILPECNKEKWKDVTLHDLLNMRTGNYSSTESNHDENSEKMVNFFLSESSNQKISMACNMFPRKRKSGNTFVYHTSDTFLAGVMMERLYKDLTGKKDVYYNLLANDLWLKLGLSPLLQQTKRTYDQQQLAFTGWGLTYKVDDVIKIAQFLHQQNNLVNKPRLLDKDMLANAMQTSKTQINRLAGKEQVYNNGFWGLEVSQALNCKKQKWIPFMSGYGGIIVAMISPDILYYNFSDNNQFEWLNILIELNKQFPLCETI